MEMCVSRLCVCVCVLALAPLQNIIFRQLLLFHSHKFPYSSCMRVFSIISYLSCSQCGIFTHCLWLRSLSVHTFFVHSAGSFVGGVFFFSISHPLHHQRCHWMNVIISCVCFFVRFSIHFFSIQCSVLRACFCCIFHFCYYLVSCIRQNYVCRKKIIVEKKKRRIFIHRYEWEDEIATLVRFEQPERTWL